MPSDPQSTSSTDCSAAAPRKPSWIFRLFRVGLFCSAIIATLIFLYYTEENIRLDRAWSAHLREMSAKGETLDWKALTPTLVPEAQNFAQTPVLWAIVREKKKGEMSTSPLDQLFGIFPALSFPNSEWLGGKRVDWVKWWTELRKKKPDLALPADGKPGEIMLTFLQPLEPVLIDLSSAARERPAGQFVSRFFSPNVAEEVSYDKLVILIRVIAQHALAELACHAPDRAAADVLILKRLSDATREDGSALGTLIATAATKIVLQLFWEGEAGSMWKPEQVAFFQEYFASAQEATSMAKALRRERAHVHVLVLGGSFARDFIDLPRWADRAARFGPHAWVYETLILRDNSVQKYIEAGFAAKPVRFFPSVISSADEEAKPYLQSFNPLVRAFGALTFDSIAREIARSQTLINEGTIVCALERYRITHGNYPDALAALSPDFLRDAPTDLMTGKAYRYQLNSSGKFLLYSVGLDENDDNGDPAKDWVWPQAPVATP